MELKTTFQVKDRKSLQDIASLLTAEKFERLRIAGTVESRRGPWKWRHADGREVLVELLSSPLRWNTGKCEKDSTLHLENEYHICRNWQSEGQ